VEEGGIHQFVVLGEHGLGGVYVFDPAKKEHTVAIHDETHIGDFSAPLSHDLMLSLLGKVPVEIPQEGDGGHVLGIHKGLGLEYELSFVFSIRGIAPLWSGFKKRRGNLVGKRIPGILVLLSNKSMALRSQVNSSTSAKQTG